MVHHIIAAIKYSASRCSAVRCCLRFNINLLHFTCCGKDANKYVFRQLPHRRLFAMSYWLYTYFFYYTTRKARYNDNIITIGFCVIFWPISLKFPPTIAIRGPQYAANDFCFKNPKRSKQILTQKGCRYFVCTTHKPPPVTIKIAQLAAFGGPFQLKVNKGNYISLPGVAAVKKRNK